MSQYIKKFAQAMGYLSQANTLLEEGNVACLLDEVFNLITKAQSLANELEKSALQEMLMEDYLQALEARKYRQRIDDAYASSYSQLCKLVNEYEREEQEEEE